MSDEITEPTVHLCWNDFAIRGAVHALRMANLGTMADDMEAQLKPDDPVEDLVQEFANRNWDVDDADDVRWKYFITPNRLREFAVEVLRVGSGEPSSSPAAELSRMSIEAHIAKQVHGRSQRFCSLGRGCRMADGHQGMCQP